MQRGPKRKSIDAKKAAGTYRPYRDKPKHLVVATAAPTLPEWLPAAARAIWEEELPRVIQSGTCELDSSLFADYCYLASIARARAISGEEPKSTQMVELRKLRELLGIGGAPSRAMRGTQASADYANPFANLLGE